MAVLAKRAAFLFLRAKQEVSLYEDARPESNGVKLRLLHVGDPFRAKEFIEGIFGFLPSRRVIGHTTFCVNPESMRDYSSGCDVILIETNRLFANRFRRAGYFTIPEWVEFGRLVVVDPAARYAGATKSLKSDLLKIRRSKLRAVTTTRIEDFQAFYEKMFLPHVTARFRGSLIFKSMKKLQGDFLNGFLFILEFDGSPIAGAVVRVDGRMITETAIGVLNGSDRLLRMGVSGALDYHLHEWAAQNGKSFISVGHTRPFPENGVYFNKRKWMMTLLPDQDGVTDMAVRFLGRRDATAGIISRWPFVFQGETGLQVLCSPGASQEIDLHLIQKLRHRYWTDGIRNLLILSPRASRDIAFHDLSKPPGPNIRLFSDCSTVSDIQNGPRTEREAR